MTCNLGKKCQNCITFWSLKLSPEFRSEDECSKCDMRVKQLGKIMVEEENKVFLTSLVSILTPYSQWYGQGFVKGEELFLFVTWLYLVSFTDKEVRLYLLSNAYKELTNSLVLASGIGLTIWDSEKTRTTI